MAIQLSDAELALMITSLRRMLDSRWPTERAVELAANVDEGRRFFQSLQELGLGAALGASEDIGLDMALLICQELGRASCPLPLIGVWVANRLLHHCQEHPVRGFMDAVGSGEAFPGLALGSFDGDPAAGEIRVADGRVTGTLAFVEGASIATHLVLFAAEPAGVAIVRADEAGVRISPTPGLALPPLSAVELDAPLFVWSSSNDRALFDASILVRLANAARALGSSQRAFDLTVEYAKVRRQFGHAIGEFQAIQHKLADCLTRLDGSRISLSTAAKAFDRNDPQWPIFANAALAFSGPALRQVLLESHHTMGAIGYSEEHELPRHFRRVHADLVRFGGVKHARAALADHLLA